VSVRTPVPPPFLCFVFFITDPAPPALYTPYDSLAAGLLNGLTDAGISVPADIEVIVGRTTFV
ncbi:hypothetical protein GIX77_10525, partial [Lactobacillus reuteri]